MELWLLVYRYKNAIKRLHYNQRLHLQLYKTRICEISYDLSILKKIHPSIYLWMKLWERIIILIKTFAITKICYGTFLRYIDELFLNRWTLKIFFFVVVHKFIESKALFKTKTTPCLKLFQLGGLAWQRP